jgi:UDP-glucose 4-epimerase
MNICITGALGHIGSKLIRNLTIDNLEKVYLVDNFLTQRYASLFDLPDGIDFTFYEIDVHSKIMESIVEKCDVLVHLAAVTDAEKSFERADEVEKINRKALEYVAGLCADAGCSLLFPSTTSVYGTQEKVVDENCSARELKPQSPYADSKLFGERLLAELADKKGLKYVILRIGTIFGYSIGMRFHTAVNKFVWQAATGQPITIWTTALNQKRPYCDLSDCVRALNFFINKNCFDNQIYNIVTDNFTVQHLVNVIKKYLPEINISFVDSPIMNQLSYEVSNKKSIELGLTYQGNLEAGIIDTILKLRNVNTGIKMRTTT